MSIVKTIAFLLLAALLAFTGWLVPAELRGLEEGTLSYAASLGTSNQDKIQAQLDAALAGPASRLLDGTRTDDHALEDALKQLLATQPILSISGGPDRSFQDFAELVQLRPQPSPQAVVPLLLPRSIRALSPIG